MGKKGKTTKNAETTIEPPKSTDVKSGAYIRQDVLHLPFGWHERLRMAQSGDRPQLGQNCTDCYRLGDKVRVRISDTTVAVASVTNVGRWFLGLDFGTYCAIYRPQEILEKVS